MARRDRPKISRKKAAALRMRGQRAAAWLTSQLAGVAEQLGASEFAMLLVTTGAAQCQLRPLVDSDYPKASRMSKRLSNKTIEGSNRRLHRSTRPFWWRQNARLAPQALCLADEDDLLGLGGRGLALPLNAGPGQNGLVVFAGPELNVTDDALVKTHLLCLHLLETADEVQTGASRSRLAMSNRELDCLRLTADGKTSEEIGELLGLSRHTANQYLTSACQKLNAVNRTQAVSKAMRSGLIG